MRLLCVRLQGAHGIEPLVPPEGGLQMRPICSGLLARAGAWAAAWAAKERQVLEAFQTIFSCHVDAEESYVCQSLHAFGFEGEYSIGEVALKLVGLSRPDPMITVL